MEDPAYVNAPRPPDTESAYALGQGTTDPGAPSPGGPLGRTDAFLFGPTADVVATDATATINMTGIFISIIYPKTTNTDVDEGDTHSNNRR